MVLDLTQRLEQILDQNMGFKVVLSEVAEENQIAFLEYYLSVSPRIANLFLAEFDEIIALISENPFLFGERYKRLRIANIKRFKTLICYRIDIESKIVIVYTIVRSERNPKAYLK